MKRSKLCIGFLTLSVPAVLLCLMSSDVSALKHEYEGMPLLSPVYRIKTNSSRNYISWTSNWYTDDDLWSFSPAPFRLSFEGDSWDSSLANLRVRKDIRYLNTSYNPSTQKCTDAGTTFGFTSVYRNDGSINSLSEGISSTYPNIFPQYGGGSNIGNSSLQDGYYFFPDAYTGDSACWSRQGMSSYDLSSYDRIVNGGLPSWPNGSDLALYNLASVINNDNVLPYNYYTDTIPFTSSHRQSDGVVYNKSFSFDVLFNQQVKSFSRLSLSLDDYGGYWYDDTNLTRNRSIDFHFLFRFEAPFTFSNTFINGGSLKIRANAVSKTINPDEFLESPEFTCTSTQRQVGENDYYWDISCPVTLSKNYIVFVPELVIDGNGNKVFSTDGNWSFSSLYIITDHDSTPGRSFNDSPTGNSSIWDAYWSDNNNQANPGDADWLQTLASLFSFDFFNPFAPIFQMFSDNNSCAQIPVLAGMIHSEETQVCPWFDSTTRNIVTPVLGLASMMLVFGFAVRWLGSSSGNMFEDSGQHDISSSSTLRSKWRKK